MTRASNQWSLSQEGLDRLLGLLDADRDRAGLKYETLRRKLLRFFQGRNCHPAEELADETLDRVSRKLTEGVEILLPEPGPYVYGVARNVAREAFARAARTPRTTLVGSEAEVADPASSEPSAEERGGALDCLDRCLEALPIETRQLLLLHHSGQERGRLADRLGIRPGTLWVRMHRLRKRLERCVRDCMESNPSAMGKVGGTVRHSPVKGEDEP